jgi:hypothetical protein
MLGLGKTSTVRPSAAVDSALGQDIYRRYATALYRQALLAVDDWALAEHAVCDVLVNERALAALPGIHRRDMAALWRAVLHRLTASSAAAVEDGDQG